MNPMRYRTSMLLVPLVLVVAGGLALNRHYTAPPPDSAAPAQAPVRVGADALTYPAGAPQLAYLDIRPVMATAVPLLDGLPARIAYDEDHTARITSPVSGRVLKILAQPGDAIKVGQVLAEVDAPEYASALSDVRKARADVMLKRAAFERARALHGAGIVATRDLEAAQADARSAEAEVVRAEARLGNLGGDSSRYVLRSPIEGVVAERHLNPAQELRAEQVDPLFVITDPRRFDVVADIPEQDIGYLRPGQTLKVEVEAVQDAALEARVRQIGVALDAGSRRLPLRAHLVATDPRLRAEMFARVTPVDSTAPPAVRVPNSSLLTSGLHSYVFVEVEPRRLVKREVTLAMRGHRESYVSSGLSGGERIVTRGVLMLDADLGGDS